MSKLKTKEQTDKLNEARFEFLKRNPKKREEFLNLLKQNEEKRDAFTTALASFSKDNPKIKAAWDFFFDEAFFDKGFKDIMEGLVTHPAANVGIKLHHFLTAYAHEAMMSNGKNIEDMTMDELNEKYMAYLCKHSREVFAELTNGQPARHVLIGVDMGRTKEAILAEVADIITEHQNAAGLDIPKERLRWLSIVDELLAVWDAWESHSQRRCFHLIARKFNISESTAKARWRLAYRLIHGEEFTKERATDDAIHLCAKCTEQKKCYKIMNGEMEFQPCSAYVKLAGKGYSNERYVEDIEKFASYIPSDNSEI